MVNISGRDGRITSRQLHAFTGGTEGGSWSWGPGRDIAAATDASRLEAGVPLAELGSPGGEMGAFYYMTDWKQKRDTGDRIFYDLRTQGGRGAADGGTAAGEGAGPLGQAGPEHPPLHAPEFDKILLPLAGMTAVFALVRRSRKGSS